MTNDILYSPLETEDRCSDEHEDFDDRKIVEYLLTLYRSDCHVKRLYDDLDKLSEAWEKAGRSCEWGGLKLMHGDRAIAKAKHERESVEHWKELTAKYHLDDHATAMGEPEDDGGYVLPPPVVPPTDDKEYYGFSE